ncbi:hypothetical protein [Photobacterium sanguinicancri]|uniref:hypothetical protein n=1 Tax=Photobacterium sanguinicancri TaxID=875932 RepID=UPI0021C49B18|nr:hypothetical protein [Photobacterium sanguinicancri]
MFKAVLKNCLLMFTCMRFMPKPMLFLYILLLLTMLPILLLGFLPWPNAEYSLNGQELNYLQFWTSGLAVGFLLVCLGINYICLVVAQKRKLGRLGLPFVWLLFFLPIAFDSGTGLVIWCIISVSLVGYFLLSEKVKNYFYN